MHIMGTILNSASSTVKNIERATATIYNKNNDTLVIKTVNPKVNTLRSHETTTFEILISPETVKLTDIAFIKFELTPIVVSNGATAGVATSTNIIH
jgi:hypothetical protein